MSEHIQASLDALRNIRTGLYQVPEEVTSRMSLEDQVKYGNNLNRIGLLIMMLEKEMMSDTNNSFKQQENKLIKTIKKMEETMESNTRDIHMIRIVNDSLNIIDNIIDFLH
jgi:hypothetical protein